MVQIVFFLGATTANIYGQNMILYEITKKWPYKTFVLRDSR